MLQETAMHKVSLERIYALATKLIRQGKPSRPYAFMNRTYSRSEKLSIPKIQLRR